MYSRLWAENVQRNHYKNHSRVAYFLFTHTLLSSKILVNWLMKNDWRWYDYKRAIDFIESRLPYRPGDCLTVETATRLYSVMTDLVVEYCQTPIGGWLTGYLAHGTIKVRLLSGACSADPSGSDGENSKQDVVQLRLDFYS